VRNWLHILVAALAAFTLWWRIDGTVLWRDEATTACWAREMVERREFVPRVFNGERLIVQAPDGHDFTDTLLPAMQGWLQFYVTALGFWLGGVGTVQARAPFVLAGAAALVVLYRLGRELFGGERAALGLPLLGATSIYFLTPARQARYYILIVLFTLLILWEFARYLKEPERARTWGFYLRLGLYGALTYLGNYVSFGGLWVSLTVFVLLTRDLALIRRFLVLSGVLAVPMALEFWWVHSDFVAGSVAALPMTGRDWWAVLQYHWREMFRMIPLLVIVPAAWYVYGRRRERSRVALLCLTIVVVSMVVTIGVARMGAAPRYYFQTMAAALVLTGMLGERVWVLAGKKWGVAYFAFALVWPNLNFYHNWCEHAVERQLTRDTTCNEPIVEFLRKNVKPQETVAFHRNVQGMMTYFNLPWLKWVDLLDADEPRNKKRRGLLPDYVFDDWEGADWYVIWDDRGTRPKKLNDRYKLVWEYSYLNPKSLWDWDFPNRVLGYKVYRRVGGTEPRP
jgi:4-amino-4-deoxy-L-arabinose transferase-like glycosyltransferase